MIGVVLDTNVVVSALLNDEGTEATVVDLAVSGEVRLFASKAILSEYEEILSRPKFALSIHPDQIQALMSSLHAVAVMAESEERLTVSQHEPDNRFLECAEAAQADFLVTGNKRHFPAEWKATRIVNARELFSLIDLETDEPG
jgi:putative PIN family toxin of toxin-antitoxin system